MRRLAAFLALAVLAAAQAVAAENDWLLGKWELSYDPEGSPKDWLEFTDETHANAITPEGRRIPGRYVIKGSRIAVTFSYNGKMVPLNLTFAADKKKLLSPSKKTMAVSEYQKVK